jgi:pilus assembly protein CpaE
MEHAVNKPAWKPLIVCPAAALCDSLRMALEELNVRDYTHLISYPRLETARKLAHQHQANVVFLDVATNPDEAMALVADLSEEFGVVALHPSGDADMILRCLRRGASEFLFGALTSGRVKEVLERVATLRQPAQAVKAAPVYAVVPGKPGCGASTVAVHLALGLKQAGLERVLLMDLDLCTGSVGFLLKLKPDFHLEHALHDSERLDKEMWHRLVVRVHGIEVLAAPEHAARLHLDAAAAERIITFCRSQYDAIVVDTPGLANPLTIALAVLSDHVLLTTTNELAPLHSTSHALTHLESGGLARNRVKLLLNRYTPSTGLTKEEVARALQLEVYSTLANDYDMLQRALLEGRPAPPTCRFSRSLAALCEKLAGVAPVPGKGAARKSWLPFLAPEKSEKSA